MEAIVSNVNQSNDNLTMGSVITVCMILGKSEGGTQSNFINVYQLEYYKKKKKKY